MHCPGQYSGSGHAPHRSIFPDPSSSARLTKPVSMSRVPAILARISTAAALLAIAGACMTGQTASSTAGGAAAAARRTMTESAEAYVKLVLALGVHDADYVDAYYGPPEWRAAADSAKLPVAAIRERAAALRGALTTVAVERLDETSRLRHQYLDKQLRAMVARIDIIQGKRLSFDEESRELYDAVAPTSGEAHFQSVLDRLDGALPGTGTVAERYAQFRSRFVIPREKVDTVFRAAIAACRERTARHVTLPAGERFTVEYVTDKPWSGYNWYKGNYQSVIQVNTDLPIFVDRAVDLACHEGYPGHHVYNVLLEQSLVRGRGWREFSVYALFSPQSLIAEGSANHGIAMAFPGRERVEFERRVLYPLAGLEPARADEYERVQALVKELSFAGNEAARRYLDGAIDAAAAAEWLTRYSLMEPARAQQRVRFIDKYRSYVINYNLGERLVRGWVESRAGDDRAKQWALFTRLLSTPMLPSDLGQRPTP